MTIPINDEIPLVTIPCDRQCRTEPQHYKLDYDKTGLLLAEDGDLRRDGDISVDESTLFVRFNNGSHGCYPDDVIAVVRDLYALAGEHRPFYNTPQFKLDTGKKGVLRFADGYVDEEKCIHISGSNITFKLFDGEEGCHFISILTVLIAIYQSFVNRDEATDTVIKRLEDCIGVMFDSAHKDVEVRKTRLLILGAQSCIQESACSLATLRG